MSKSNKTKGILIREDCRNAQIVSISDLKDYYKYLKCNCIDIKTYEIGGKLFSIVFDDEFELDGDHKATVINEKMNILLKGNVFICKHNEETGEAVSLSAADIELIYKNLYVFVEEQRLLLHAEIPEGYYITAEDWKKILGDDVKIINL